MALAPATSPLCTLSSGQVEPGVGVHRIQLLVGHDRHGGEGA